MIGRLVGTLVEKHPPLLLVDVGGVGYEVQASMTTIYQLPDTNQKVTLHTHLVVREDSQTLYGFYDKKERALFTRLVKVNGIGPKMALAILSSTDAQGFARCVQQNDVTALTKIPGVGKKTAERLIIEMRDKFKDELPGEAMTIGASEDSPEADAVSALISLGYKPQQATDIVKKLSKEASDSESLIRLSLKALNRF